MLVRSLSLRRTRVRNLTDKAMAFLNIGYSVYCAGAAGTGKTTLAFHLAAVRERPVILISLGNPRPLDVVRV